MPTIRRTYRAPAALEDRLSGELWQAGTLGVEIQPAPGDEIRLVAYFAASPGSASSAPELDGATLLDEAAVPERDWLAEWRARAQPIAVADRWLIDPREPEQGVPSPIPPALAAGRHVLRLPARTAFGLGSHESTRLVLELMAELELGGRRVLEVGCGTGILALAARSAGAAWAVGFDTDRAAPLLAGQYARDNGLAASFFAGSLAALRADTITAGGRDWPSQRIPPLRAGARSPFDLALVNVIPEQIFAELPALAGLLAGGEAIFSGILAAEGEAAAAALAAAGFTTTRERRDGEWVAFLTRCVCR